MTLQHLWAVITNENLGHVITAWLCIQYPNLALSSSGQDTAKGTVSKLGSVLLRAGHCYIKDSI